MVPAASYLALRHGGTLPLKPQPARFSKLTLNFDFWNPGPLEGQTNRKDRGRVRRDRSRTPCQNPTLATAAPSESWVAGQAGRQSPGPSSDPAERPGPHEAPGGKPHT